MKEDIYNTDKKYRILYADPPWEYFTYSKTGKGRSAESHYPTMEKTEIQKLPIPAIAAKDSVLFLWVTAPCLIEGIELTEKQPIYVYLQVICARYERRIGRI